MSANSAVALAGLDRVAGDEDRLDLGPQDPGLDAADEGVAEDHDRAAARAPGHALGLAEHEPVDAVLLGLDRAHAAEAAEQPLVERVQVRGVDEAVDQLLLAHHAGRWRPGPGGSRGPCRRRSA